MAAAYWRSRGGLEGRAARHGPGRNNHGNCAATADAARRGMTREEKKVIFASSLGTVFEWYDFYLYGSLAAFIGATFFSAVSGSHAQHLRAAGLCRRLPGAPVRRAGVRPHRRPRRPQIHLPRHHPDHGPVDLPGRPAARCGIDRHRRAGHPDRAAHAAGPGARRRIWRRGDLCRRARARRPARLLHLVDPDHGDARPVPVADRHPDRPELDEQGRVRRLGLAHSVPALLRPARHLGLDPAVAERIAGLPDA